MLMTWMNWFMSGDRVDELLVHKSEGGVAKSRAGICARILFLHPHPLTLVQPNHYFSCFACHSEQREGWVFRCDKCNFNLDLKCAFIGTWPSSIEKRDEQLRTLSNHEHPLVLFFNVPKDCIQCSFCGKYCSVPTYACFPCNIFLHPSCYEPNFPLEIQHFYHTCPLTLYTYIDDPDANESYRCICRACYEPLQPRTFYYGCSKCGFEMHVDCTSFPTDKSSTSQDQIRCHFLHGHPLSLTKIIRAFPGVYCYACWKRCINSSAYACFHPSCKNAVYICETCIELPQEICHPFHPDHLLTLQQQYHPGIQKKHWTAPLSGIKCNACRKDTNIVIYICQSCNFRLHVGCSEAIAAIEYEGHNHLLQFKKIIDGQLIMCGTCNSTCDSYAFSCLYCNLNYHLTCGPLPYTIKHKSHIDPLILTYSLAIHEHEREDEFCCDACEEERDPLLPIYQCQECKFVAEVKCVISEVTPSLNGEYGDVELRSPNGQHVRIITKDVAKEMLQKKEEQRKPALTTFFDIFKSMSKNEKNELSSVGKAIEREIATAKEILYQDDDEVLLFSDKVYTKFIKFLDDHSIDNIPINEYESYDHGRRFLDLSPDQAYQLSPFLPHFFSTEGTVNVGDYVVTKKFAPILNHLLSTLGDISTKSMLSPRVKVFLFDMLCVCIYRMKNMKVVDITHDLLVNWSTILKTLQRAGFRIQFAIDHLKRLSRAHYGLHLRVQVDNAIEKIDTDIDRLKKDLEALKVKRELITSAETKKSTFIDECLREASLLKRWRAGGLL